MQLARCRAVAPREVEAARKDPPVGNATEPKAEHPGYPSIIVGEEHPAEVWGVVVGCVRKMG